MVYQEHFPFQRRHKIFRIPPIPFLKQERNWVDHISYTWNDKELKKKKIPYGDMPASCMQQLTKT